MLNRQSEPSLWEAPAYGRRQRAWPCEQTSMPEQLNVVGRGVVLNGKVSRCYGKRRLRRRRWSHDIERAKRAGNPSFHLITLSARYSTDCGIVRLSAFAV